MPTESALMLASPVASQVDRFEAQHRRFSKAHSDRVGAGSVPRRETVVGYVYRSDTLSAAADESWKADVGFTQRRRRLWTSGQVSNTMLSSTSTGDEEFLNNIFDDLINSLKLSDVEEPHDPAHLPVSTSLVHSSDAKSETGKSPNPATEGSSKDLDPNPVIECEPRLSPKSRNNQNRGLASLLSPRFGREMTNLKVEESQCPGVDRSRRTSNSWEERPRTNAGRPRQARATGSECENTVLQKSRRHGAPENPFLTPRSQLASLNIDHCEDGVLLSSGLNRPPQKMASAVEARPNDESKMSPNVAMNDAPSHRGAKRRTNGVTATAEDSEETPIPWWGNNRNGDVRESFSHEGLFAARLRLDRKNISRSEELLKPREKLYQSWDSPPSQFNPSRDDNSIPRLHRNSSSPPVSGLQRSGSAREVCKGGGGLNKVLKNIMSFQKSFPQLLKSKQMENEVQYRRKVVVNELAINDFLVKQAEESAGPIHPGRYWYDMQAGFWGVESGPCIGIIPAFIPEFDHPMSRSCSGGDTRVVVNGRELHSKDLEKLSLRGLPTVPGSAYQLWVDGKLVDVASGKVLKGLGKLAPSLEGKRRGAGMYFPCTD